MKPISLKLKNFRSFDLFEYEFQPGVTGIMGPNFTGKSNFSELGTRFSWLGTTPSGLNKKDLVKWDCAEGSTKWVFEHGGEIYTIRRSIPGAGISLTWGSEELTDHASVQKKMEEIIGIDLSLVSDYCFVPQFTLTNILETTRSARLEYFLQLVGWSSIQHRRKLLQEAASSIPVHPDRSENIDNIEDRLKGMQDELSKDAVELERKKETCSPGRLSEIARLLELPTEEKRKAAASEVRLEMAGVEKELSSLTAEDPGRETPRVTQEQLKFLKWKSVETEYIESMSQLDNIPEGKVPEDPIDMRIELERLKKEYEDLEEPLNRYSLGVCPECNQPLENASAKVEELISRRQELKNNFLKLKETYKVAQEAYKKALSEKNDNDIKRQKLERRLAALEEHKTDIKDNVENIERIDKEHKDWENKRRRYEDTSSLRSKLGARKVSLEVKLGTIEAYETCGEDKEVLELEKKNLEQAALEVAGLEKRMHGMEMAMKEVSSERDRLIKEQKARATADSAVTFLERARDVLHKDRLPSLVLEDRRRYINDLLAKYLEGLESGFTSFINREFDFRINFENGKSDRPVKELSGGQRVMLALVFHLAKLKLLPQVPFLVLDEPTMYLNRSVITDVAGMFSRFSRENPGTYVLVPTHEPELAECFDRIKRIEPASLS